MPGGAVQSGVAAALGRRVLVGAPLQQRLDAVDIAGAGGVHERGVAVVLGRCVEVRPMLAQQLERVQVPVDGRQGQRRVPTPVLRVGADAVGDQPLHGLELVVPRGPGELRLLGRHRSRLAPIACAEPGAGSLSSRLLALRTLAALARSVGGGLVAVAATAPAAPPPRRPPAPQQRPRLTPRCPFAPERARGRALARGRADSGPSRQKLMLLAAQNARSAGRRPFSSEPRSCSGSAGTTF